jgi:quercetin dioxygenase-like cupin family protein
MTTFAPLIIRPGLLLDLDPIRVWGWTDEPLTLPSGATAFGMVTTGRTRLHDADAGPFGLGAGMFFVLPDGGVANGGRGLAVTWSGYRGLRQIGGPLETAGRLRYIDGCSDTLLVCPPRLGDPCLNHLHIPPRTDQTPHTHPSVRIGVILRGTGECRTPEGVYPLRPGMGWYIPTGCLHSFFTRDEALDVIAWHPDSDFGPRDDDHPMLNRTQIPPR